MEDRLKQIYSHSKNNYTQVKNGKVCGCFCCQKIFDANKVKNYLNDSLKTAICPFCGVDAVVAQTDKIIIDAKILCELNKKYFN